MKQLLVIAPMGATIRGPAVLALTEDQARRRSAQVTKGKRKDQYDLGEGVGLTFKHGETFGIDKLDRLNPQLFEDLDAAREAEQAAAKAAEAEAAAKADADALAAAQANGGTA